MSILDSSSSLKTNCSPSSSFTLGLRNWNFQPKRLTPVWTALLSDRCRHSMSLLLGVEDMMELSDDMLPRLNQLLPYIEHLIVEPVRNFILGPALLELENVYRIRKSLINHIPNHSTLAIQNRLLSEYLNWWLSSTMLWHQPQRNNGCWKLQIVLCVSCFRANVTFTFLLPFSSCMHYWIKLDLSDVFF